MASVTSLGFNINSTYSGRGMARARRDLQGLGRTIVRIDQVNRAVSRVPLQGLMGIAIATAPALIAVGQAAASVAGSTIAMGTAAGTAGGIFAAAMAGAARRAFELRDAGEKLNSSQKNFVQTVTRLKNEWNSFLDATSPQTLGVATVAINGLRDALRFLPAIINAVEPAARGVAEAFRAWVNRDNGLLRFVNVVRAHGVPALQSLLNAGRHVLTFLGEGFRAFAPLGAALAETLERGARALARWAQGGGFQRFIQRVQERGPMVREFFSALGQAMSQVFQAMDGLVPVALRLSTALLRIVAALPIPVIQGLILAMAAWRLVMVAATVRATLLAAAHLLMARRLMLLRIQVVALMVQQRLATIVMTAWGAITATSAAVAGRLAAAVRILAVAMRVVFIGAITLVVTALKALWALMLAHPIGLIIVAVAALVGGIIYLATQTQFFQTVWRVSWNAIKVAAQVAWTAIQVIFNTMANYLQSVLSIAWMALRTTVEFAWGGIRAAVTFSWTVIRGVFNVIITMIRGSFRAAWTFLRTTVEFAWGGIRAAATFSWTVIRGVFNIIITMIRGALRTAWVFFRTVVESVWGGVRAAATFSWTVIRNVFNSIVSFLRGAMSAAWNFFRNFVDSIWGAIRSATSFSWNFIQTLWSRMTSFIRGPLSGAWNFFRNFVDSIWGAIRSATSFSWNFIQTIWQRMNSFIRGPLSGAWNFFRNFVDSIWGAIRSFSGSAWNWLRNNVFQPLMDFIRGPFVQAWRVARNNIGTIWDKLREVVAGPVRFFVETVYNNGLRRAWNNTVAKIPGVPNLPEAPGFAQGGAVQGPGGPRADKIPAMLSDGEYVMRASAVDRLGAGTLDKLNRNPGMAKKGDPGGGSITTAKNARLEPHPFAKGGLVGKGVQNFALGGLATSLPSIDVDDIIGGAISSAIDIAKGSEFLGGGGGIFDFITDAAATVVPGLSMSLPAFDWASGLFHDVAKKAIGALLNPFKDLAKNTINDRYSDSGDFGTAIIKKFEESIDSMIEFVFGLSQAGMASGFKPFRPWQAGDGRRVGYRGVTVNYRTQQMLHKAEGIANQRFSPSQGSWSNASASAGTHSGGGAIDLNPTNNGNVGAMRASGFAAWARGQGFGSPSFGRHIHGIAVGDQQLSGAAQSQVRDFFAGKNGLADGGPDNYTPPGGGGGGAGVARWRGLAARAMSMGGINPNQLQAFMSLMQAESGGNPRAVNRTDINAQRGQASRGLMQVIPPTFRANHVAGTSNNIMDPLANMAAAASYIRSRYGGRVPTSPYAEGGLVDAAKAPVYDRGGFLAPGLNLINNQTGHSEPVGNNMRDEINIHIHGAVYTKSPKEFEDMVVDAVSAAQRKRRLESSRSSSKR